MTAYCDVYDAVGPGSQQVSLIRPADVSFSFAPRTILESRDMYLMAVMGRRVPKSPDPNPDARW